MRITLRLLVAAALAVAFGAISPAAAPVLPASPDISSAPRTKEQSHRAPSAPPKTDADGDRIFDDLEARLARSRPADRARVIVVLSAPPTAARIAALERRLGAFKAVRRFAIVDAFAAELTKTQVERLAGDPAVVHVEQNSRVRALNDGAQASFGVTKARGDVPSLDGDGDGNRTSYSKNDLVAAVIDTGIDAGHLDLDGGKVIGFKDFVNGRTAPYDDQGHGTHVSATIAGDGSARPDRLYHGVAPAAALVGVKVLDAQGNGTEADVVAALDWVVANKDVYGIEAINLSLGAAGCSDGTSADSLAVNRAHAAGIVVAVAAGNEGPGACTVGDPGAAKDALTVGAMADLGAEGFKQAYFSSRGPTADGRIKPDVSAPGVKVTSAEAGTTNGYVEYDGTSMATPFVAGTALLMLDANRTLMPQQVKDRMISTAVDWGRGGDGKTAGTTGKDDEYGAGRLDAYAALAAAGAPLSTPPALASHSYREGSLPGTNAVQDFPVAVADTQFPIAATLTIPITSGGNPDFDLYLISPNGATLATSEYTTRQEEVGVLPPVAGTYTVRVKSFFGSGPFYLDISHGATATAPTNVAPPLLSGTARDGSALAASTGTWWGSGVTYAYQWLRCDAAGAACSNVVGATAASYTAVGADVGSTLRVRVSGTDSGGTTAAMSEPSAVVTGSGPVNTSLPTISGTARDGWVLQATTGTWSGTTPTFAYQWRRCDSSGANCVDVAGARNSTYTLSAVDVGSTMRVVVTATNSAGTSSATSGPTAVVSAAPPANTAQPAISGTARDGETLTASTGTWSGTAPLSYAYQWRRCDSAGANCIDVGARVSTYTLGAGDIGSTLRVVVTATNAGGSATATAAATAVIVAVAPASTGAPTIAGTAREGNVLTASQGTWTGSPTLAYAYQWRRCDAASSCVDIAGATSATYTGASADIDATLLVRVTASNSAGSASRDSAPTSVVAPAPPSSIDAPVVTGTATDGQTLSVSTGSWRSSRPLTYSYQWQRCDGTGASCAPIAGETAATHALTPADVDSTVRAVVTAMNSGGSASRPSAATAVVRAAAPENVDPPTVEGNARERDVVRAAVGTWRGTPPLVHEYQWLKCDATGANCVEIASATESAYRVVTADIDSTLRVRVATRNAGGSQTVTSKMTRPVRPAPPVNIVAPATIGTAREGETLTATSGSWASSLPMTLAYQWQRCDAAAAICVDVAGGTLERYSLAAEDVGYAVRVRVTASNAEGATDAFAPATVPVVASAPPAAPPPPPPAAPPPPSPPAPPAPPPPPTPPAPQPAARAVQRCVVPNLKGRSLAAARRALVRAGCAVGNVRSSYSTRVRKGYVIAQTVRAGSRVRRGTRVGLLVSRGRARR